MTMSGLALASPRIVILAAPAPSLAVGWSATSLRRVYDLTLAAYGGASAEALSPGRAAFASFPSKLIGLANGLAGLHVPRAMGRRVSVFILGPMGAILHVKVPLQSTSTPMGRLGMVPRAAAGLSLLAEALPPGGVVPAVPNLLIVTLG